MHFLRVRNLGAASQLHRPGTSMRLQSDCQWGLQSSESSPYSHCFRQEASFPHYVGLLQGCCQLASLKTNDPQERVCPICKLYNLISDVTYCHFCVISLSTQTNSGIVWEGLHRDPWRPSWRLTTTPTINRNQNHLPKIDFNHKNKYNANKTMLNSSQLESFSFDIYSL